MTLEKKPEGEGNEDGEKRADEPKQYTQEQIDRIIEGRLTRERKDSAAKIAEMNAKLEGMTAAEQELEELRLYREEKEGEKLSAEERLRAKHQREMKALEDEANKWKGTAAEKEKVYNDFRKDVALTSAASKLNAIDSQQVVTLLKTRTQLVEEGDGMKLVFIGDDGAELSVEEGVKEYLSNNPHLVRNTGPNGGGALYPVTKGGLTPEIVSKMTRKQRTENADAIEAMLKAMPKDKGSGVR